MADQAAAPPQAAPEGPPPGRGADPIKIHGHALAAEKELEQLATELANADVDPKVVKTISGMAEAMRKVAHSFAKGAATPPPPQHSTIASATDGMMADRAAARQPTQ